MAHGRMLGVAAVGVVTLAVAAGCGNSDSSSTDTAADTGTAAATAASTAAATTPAAEPANVAYVTYTYETYIKAEEAGLKRAVEPGGGSVKVFNGNADPDKQTQACKDAITSGRYNVIALEPLSSEIGVACVNAAKAAGIPVVGLTIPPVKDQLEPVDGVAGQVVFTRDGNAQNYAAAVKAGCEGLDPCKAIAEITYAGDPASKAALDAAKAAVPNLEIEQEIIGNYDPATLQKALPDALAAHPDANILLGASDPTALAAIPVLKKAGRENVRIVGSGGTELGAEAVLDGRFVSTTGSWPESTGFLAGEMAIKAVNGQPIDPAGVDAATIEEPATLTKDNAGSYDAQW